MGRLLNIVTALHKKTRRDYIGRMNYDKAGCMRIAGEYGREFWDGDRRFGYGGYRYDGRWEVVAKKLAEIYGLKRNARILDVGCGKGFLLYEFKKILPEISVSGFDISKYAIENAMDEVRDSLFVHKAQNPYPFSDREFDLVISVTTLHNLHIEGLGRALEEIERVGKNKYVAVESYRNEEELFNLECWALTCRSFFSKDDWIWLFDKFAYSGDYEFIYFE